jgi:two-component system, sensor histidine kinase and response regulator
MPHILVVDDEPRNRFLLRACLEDKETTILEAESGEQALAMIEEDEPDLILLDVMMPGMDGFETTRKIKDRAGEGFLPVVLVTALTDRESRLRGLEMGADEFLTKPIDTHELKVRVRNLLALRDKELTLRKRNLNVLELMRFRDEMSALLIHDLKNPTAIVELSLDFLERQMPELAPAASEAMADARGATVRIGRIVNNMLDLVRMEADRLVLHRAPTRPALLLNQVAEVRASLARKHSVKLELHADDKLEINADVDLITRVIENVVDNSLQHVPDGGRILLTAEARGESATMMIGNDGPPVPKQLREAIFDKYGREEKRGTRRNLGLGLYFCRLAMEAHGGRIWVSDEPMPAVFGLELPIAGPGARYAYPSVPHHA